MHLWNFGLDTEMIIGNRKPGLYGNTYLGFDNGMVVVSWEISEQLCGLKKYS